MANSPTPVRILWVNPIGSPDYDQPMGEFMRGIKNADTQINVVSFRAGGPQHLEFRTYEALVIGDIIRAARDAATSGMDAMVIGCFYDPGIEAAREISGSTVVVGPCQAAVQIAGNLANRFSVIVGQNKWIQQMTERVHTYGYGDRLASMQPINIAVPDLQADCEFTARQIIEAGRRAIDEDGAEALILGCTCTFGLFEAVQKELKVPIIDPINAALKMAEALGGMKRQFDWAPSRVGSCLPPPEAEIESWGLLPAGAGIGNRYQVV